VNRLTANNRRRIVAPICRPKRPSASAEASRCRAGLAMGGQAWPSIKANAPKDCLMMSLRGTPAEAGGPKQSRNASEMKRLPPRLRLLAMTIKYCHTVSKRVVYPYLANKKSVAFRVGLRQNFLIVLDARQKFCNPLS
jgi:hypothetical protein